MPKVRRFADLAAIIEGLIWLCLAWSISFSVTRGSPELSLAAMSIVGALILVSWAHRPLRLLLRRYHVRKRRTDMWMHILALPLLLTLFLHVLLEVLLGNTWVPPKILLFNILATAGWLVFVVTLFIKFIINELKPTSR
ncbi:hypothetical protein VRRI112168_13450 [Vreelandella rituensis]|uniref:Transmembrane protein n=1 Tax=Vreelandella rituensis TaxID=2282306 RepID=A0A368U8S5_9GAMM|nr:hypothetical protein [Halomonas rituensis]RCV93354.1 hypothetical protein DU506_03320 [Halomonas rituensis]